MHDNIATDASEQTARSILDWLASARSNPGADDSEILQRHLDQLRTTQLTPERHVQLLDFLYEHTVKVVAAMLPNLRNSALPVPRRKRQEMRNIQTALESLSHDYLNLVNRILGHPVDKNSRAPSVGIWRAVNCLALHLMISHVAAAPPEVGIWQMMHNAHESARKFGLADQRIPRQERTLEQLYLSSILLACSQPASFSSQELEFIADYIPLCIDTVTLSEIAPSDSHALFWIDPDKDAPANPVARRTPPPDTDVLFFACDTVARSAQEHLDALEKGYSAIQLGVPEFAETPAGHGVLRRLAERWGKPPKRKFPRRRHSYRATLCAGLDELWHLLQAPEKFPVTPSEWMITNESPDGLAMMHMTGKTSRLKVGDLVAVRPQNAPDQAPGDWNVCIVRWALSENPEHIELGLQILAPRAVPAVVAIPTEISDPTQSPALLLPSVPPLRHSEAIVVNTGTLAEHPENFMLVVGKETLSVRELHATGLAEQTENIEVFNVETDDLP